MKEQLFLLKTVAILTIVAGVLFLIGIFTARPFQEILISNVVTLGDMPYILGLAFLIPAIITLTSMMAIEFIDFLRK